MLLIFLHFKHPQSDVYKPKAGDAFLRDAPRA